MGGPDEQPLGPWTGNPYIDENETDEWPPLGLTSEEDAAFLAMLANRYLGTDEYASPSTEPPAPAPEDANSPENTNWGNSQWGHSWWSGDVQWGHE